MLSGPLKQSCSEYFVWFCRVWGFATALILWGIGIEIAFDKELVGYYIILVAIIMSVLESVFLFHYLVKESQSDLSNSFLSFWRVILLCDDWRKAILYTLLSIFCLIRHFLLAGEAWLSIIAGTMVLLSAFLYMAKTLTNSRLQVPQGNRNSFSNTYNRIDRTAEELGSGGSITNDVSSHLADNISIQSGAALLSNAQDRSLAEQSEIMEA